MLIRVWIPSICLALLCTGVTQAQSDDPNPCGKGKTGSARGAGACFDFKLREAERKLGILESSYEKKILANTRYPELVEKLFIEEAQSWRAYRNAKCAILGGMEDGEDAWRIAWALDCRVTETDVRSKAIKKILAKNQHKP